MAPLEGTEVYAHTLPGQPEAHWEPILQHLREVAKKAAGSAAVFDSREWGELAGWWHDLGKYQPRFQMRLHGSQEQVEHAGLGAALALSKGASGTPLAFVIAGHHAGLANHVAQGDTGQLSLKDRIEKNTAILRSTRSVMPSELLDRPLPDLPSHLSGRPSTSSGQEMLRRRTEFWTRFLLSALVDADRLATQEFTSPGARDLTRAYDSLATMERSLDQRLGGFVADTPVNVLRADVLSHCREAARLPPGLFGLTVPTGGGKTFASMAFALRHAALHGLRRVIVVIPYTSIIEQNARIYREALGAQNVIEHHSNIDEEKRLELEREIEVQRRFATENWDAPVIVTTNVQFFESLFSNHPSTCRKLHNIARSVVIFDEAQSIPADYLNCILEVMRELSSEPYGCSLVLMTATQPALERRETLPAGLENVHEIIPDKHSLAVALERVTIHWPEPGSAPTSYRELASSLSEHHRALAIVHLRRDARGLAQLLPAGVRFHLSALMCPAHRSEVLTDVKARVLSGKRCLLVSTQLIEAGVDISFPVVYRALAGLDSLAQAAGRCNREGELKDEIGNPVKGDFRVFLSETRPPPGILRLGLETTEGLLRQYGGRLSFSDYDILEEYFRILYSKCEPDRKAVQSERSQFNFATVAQRVRLIDDGYTVPIVVPWGDSAERVEAFRRSPGRETQRALQPFLVQVPQREVARMMAEGAVDWVDERVHVLSDPFFRLYDQEFGLLVGDVGPPDPESFIL